MIGGDKGQLRFQWCSQCWAKSIDNTVWHDEGFAVENSFRVEIRDSYVHDAARAQPGAAGYAIWPWVDPTGTTQLQTLPAKARFDAGTPFVQP